MSALPTIGLGIDGWALRAWRGGDAPALAMHADDREVWRHMGDRFPHPYTLAIAEHWVREGHIDIGGENWAIAHDGQAVGAAAFTRAKDSFVATPRSATGWPSHTGAAALLRGLRAY